VAQRIVGLDIATSAVRAVELSVDEGTRPVLEAFGQVGLRPGAVVDGEVRDQSQVVAALQRLWSEGGFHERRVHLGVAGLRAITREVDMPAIPPEELDEAVRFQADQVVPFPLELTAISSKIIARFTDDEGATQIRVLVAAAHRQMIDRVVEAVRAAGLEPVSIDLDTAALARALDDPAFTDPEVLVSVGAGLTMVVVHQGGQLQFIRTIDMAGDTVTESLASSLDLPIPDAEALKRRLGQPGDDNDLRAESVAASAVGDLVGEIQNSIRFFASLPGRTPPARLQLTGAGSLVAGFAERLDEVTDLPVVRATPLARVDVGALPVTAGELAAIEPTIAVPVGLALPEPGGAPFNLLPAGVLAEYAERRMNRVLVLVGVVVLLLLIAGTLWRVLGVRNAEHQKRTVTHELAFIDKVEVPKFDKVVRLQDAVRTSQASYLPLVTNQADWLVVLNQFALDMPATSVLSSLSLTDTNVPGAKATGGTAAAPFATGTGTVAVPNITTFSAFGNAMSTSPAFTFGQPTGALTNSSSITFSISFVINHDAESRQTALFTEKVP